VDGVVITDKLPEYGQQGLLDDSAEHGFWKSTPGELSLGDSDSYRRQYNRRPNASDELTRVHKQAGRSIDGLRL